MWRPVVTSVGVLCLAALACTATIKPVPTAQQCTQDVQDRRDCGYFGINEQTCLQRGCCWLESNEANAPWCFNPKDPAVVIMPSTDKPVSIPATDKPSTCACKDDEIYKDTCYVIRSEFRNFEDSEKGCQEIGGHLVAIENQAEMDHVKTILAKWPTETLVWIGANDREQEGTWMWGDSSEPVTYTNWRFGEPNDDWGKEDCAAAYSMDSKSWLGLWNDIPCSEHGIPYLCEVPLKGGVTTKPQLPQSPCEADELYQGFCYKIYPEIQNFADSENSCVEKGGHLVSIFTSDEMDHVSSVLAKWPSETLVWIGLNDRAREGTYSWIGSPDPKTYSNWRYGEPNDDRGKEDCVAAYSMDDRSWLGLWNDVPCAEGGIPYMCKIPATSTPELPPSPCTADELYDGKCYKIFPELKNFADSENSCVEKGGHLVSIAESDEMKHVSSVLAKWPSETLVWIGLNDKRHEGSYSWIGSSERALYTNWRYGEPNDDRGKEDCVAAYSMDDRSWLGLWNDVPCAEGGIPYMCEL